MLLRRRMMMDTKKDSAKYPLVNGRHEFSDDSYVEVTNGNHILFFKNISNSAYVNLSNIFQNTTLASQLSNIYNKPKIYTIPSEKLLKFEIKNVQGTGDYEGETNFKLANSPASGSLHTGKFTINNPQFNTIVEKILDAPEDAGCLFLYSAMAAGNQIEFDIEFTVNGERWI